MADETTKMHEGWFLDGDGDPAYVSGGYTWYITRRDMEVGGCVNGEAWDALVALVRAAETAPTAPADDRPPGVERVSDGTLWAMPHAVIPDNYEARSATGGWGDPNITPSPNVRMYPCEVRPITPTEPATEWVPWWEAVGRVLPDGRRITAVGKGRNIGPFVEVEGYGTEVFPTVRAADGKVEVQR